MKTNTKDKSLSWWTYLKYVGRYVVATKALHRLQASAKVTGCLGVGLQAGIALEVLENEHEVDRLEWSRRKALGMYARRGLPIPQECVDAEARHSARVEKAVEK